jgi:hypothetical protein
MEEYMKVKFDNNVKEKQKGKKKRGKKQRP